MVGQLLFYEISFSWKSTNREVEELLVEEIKGRPVEDRQIDDRPADSSQMKADEMEGAQVMGRFHGLCKGTNNWKSGGWSREKL